MSIVRFSRVFSSNKSDLLLAFLCHLLVASMVVGTEMISERFGLLSEVWWRDLVFPPPVVLWDADNGLDRVCHGRPVAEMWLRARDSKGLDLSHLPLLHGCSSLPPPHARIWAGMAGLGAAPHDGVFPKAVGSSSTIGASWRSTLVVVAVCVQDLRHAGFDGDGGDPGCGGCCRHDLKLGHPHRLSYCVYICVPCIKPPMMRCCSSGCECYAFFAKPKAASVKLLDVLCCWMECEGVDHGCGVNAFSDVEYGATDLSAHAGGDSLPVPSFSA